MLIQRPLFSESEKQQIESELQQLRRATERQIENEPSQRDQILKRYEADAAQLVESRQLQKRAKNCESLAWGEAICGIAFAISLTFHWTAFACFAAMGFFACWVNTWGKGGEKYANPRLHGYVFAGTLILMALAFMNDTPNDYDPNSVYRVEHKRNGVTYAVESKSGAEMQVREKRRLENMKKIGGVLLVIASGSLLWRVAHDLRGPMVREWRN